LPPIPCGFQLEPEHNCKRQGFPDQGPPI
jgi:hypothetical protein